MIHFRFDNHVIILRNDDENRLINNDVIHTMSEIYNDISSLV